MKVIPMTIIDNPVTDILLQNGTIICFGTQKKIHFSTLNYTSCYTLHLKLFECMFCTLNYDPYYTLHLDVKFAINLDGKI